MGTKPAIRRTVWYSGRVQGVGFRFTACTIARRFAVAGYVKNLPDGRVEAAIEGAPEEVERFLSAIREEMTGHIRDERQEDSAARGDCSEFSVRY